MRRFKNVPPTRTRVAMRWVLAAFFGAAGIAHLLAPVALLAITPAWVPYPREVIFVTGLLELAGGVALMSRWRQAAGIAFAAYAVCVWPANFKHALEGTDVAGLGLSWWYHGPRLALQPVIVWASLFASEVTDWPWRSRPRG